MKNKFASEEELLQRQADEAQAALEQTWTEFKHSLCDSAKLQVWARRYPWAVAGATAAGGFLLATAICSPRAPAATANQPANGQPTNGQPANGTIPPQAAPRTGWLAWIAAPLIELIKPMLGQWLSAFAANAMGAASGPVDTGGAEGADLDQGREQTGREGPMPV